MAATWTDSEPGYFALRREVGRLCHRAGRRPFRVLAGALAVAGLAALVAYRAPRRYLGQVSLRVTEVVEFSLPRSAWTDRELRSYVTDVAFTSAVLRDVYEHHLRDLDQGRAPGPGIARLRENLQVSVVRNRIMAQPQNSEEKSGPRSAYVVLRFPAPTEARAMAVLRALTKPIIETSTRRRRDEAAQESQRAAFALAEAKLELAALTGQAMTTAGAPLAGDDVSPVRLVALQAAVNDAHRRVAHFENEKDDVERRQRAEKARPGINFDIVDESVEKPLPLVPLLAGVAILAFLFSLPLAVLMVGAFNPFIESVEDIRRLGIPILGRLRLVDRG